MKSEMLHTDCIAYAKTLPDKHFFLTIADPPYFSGPERREYYGRKVSSIGVQRIYTKMEQWAVPTQENFKEIQRVSQNLIVWGVNYFDYPFGAGRIVWDKCNANSSFSDCEIAYCSMWNSVRLFRFMWNGMLQGKSIREGHVMQGNKQKNEQRIHPTQKPVALYDWTLLTCKVPEGAKVFDPYAGSQSMRIAAYEAGFDYTGCEMDKSMYKKGCARFEAHAAQQNLYRMVSV